MLHADRFLEGNKTVPMNFLGACQISGRAFCAGAAFNAPVSIVFAFKETQPLSFYGSPLIQRAEQESNKPLLPGSWEHFFSSRAQGSPVPQPMV